MKPPFQAELDSRLCCRFAKPNFIHHFAVLVLHFVLLTPIVAFGAGPPLQFAKMVSGLYGSAVVADFQGNIYVGTGPVGPVLIKFDPNGSVIWSFRFPGYTNASNFAGQLEVSDIVLDGAENVYVSGIVFGTVRVGKIDYSANSLSMFIAKFTSSGSNVFSKIFVNMSCWNKSLACAPDGKLFVTGQILSYAPVFYEGVTVSSSGTDATVVFKLNEDGTPIWYRKGSGSGPGYPDGVTATSDSGVLAIGKHYSTSFGMAGLSLSGWGGGSLYLFRLDSTGNGLWAKSVDSRINGSYIPSGIFSSKNGQEIVWVGDFTETVGLGAPSISGTGARDAFVAKLSSSGTVLWTRAIGGTADQFGSTGAIDDFGNIYVAGFFSGRMIVGSLVLDSLGLNDIYVVKFRSDGTSVWAKRMGWTGEDNTEVAVALTRAGELLVTGTVRGGASIDGMFLEGINSSDGFLAKFHSESIPPRFITEPQSQVVSAGMTFTLAADLAVNDPSVRFQWWFNGAALPGQTNRVLSYTNAQSANAGSYYLVATNDGGQATSGSALISYTDASTLVLSVHPSLTIFGTPGRTYQIEYASDTRVPAQWTSVTNLTITSSPEVWIDPTAAVGEKRFYRVLLR